jgi:hypothetical protein
MNRFNIAVIAGLLALAAVLGTVAATHTVALGTAQKQKANTTVQSRTKQLAAYEASLKRALAKKPPALPAVPKAPPAASASVPAAQQRVVYRRPPAIVVVKHTHHGDDGSESAAGSSNGDGGGGGGGGDG